MNTPVTVGTRYDNDEGDVLAVTAIHENRGTIEFGTSDGAADETDMDAWYEMAPQEIDPPNEWYGTMDEFAATRRGRLE